MWCYVLSLVKEKMSEPNRTDLCRHLLKINELHTGIQRRYKANPLVIACNLLAVGRILRNFGKLK